MKMKNLLLGLTLLISGQVLSQTDVTIKEPFRIDYYGEVTNDFRVKIYPNPSLIGKVKMEWPDWAEVDKIQLNNTTTNQVRVIDVEKGIRKMTISDLVEGSYLVRFISEETILGIRKLKVID